MDFKFVSRNMKRKETEMSEYLVRGALLACEYGSHPRRLNLPQCHGIYIEEKPLMREDDCVVDDNISCFGICSCQTPPEGASTISLAPYGGDENAKGTVTGKQCCPHIIGTWRGISEQVKLSGDMHGISMDSFLVCKCGGLIQPLTSGQEYEE